MRLLHTTRLEFEDFFDNRIPRYAILSHRWGPDEVSYQDFLAGRKRDGAGYAKILACCRYLSHNHLFFDMNLDLRFIWRGETKWLYNLGPTDHEFHEWIWIERCDWVWIDTCNIDKSSSAELSEAINSMYNWYRGAHVCYAYLSDVTRQKIDFWTVWDFMNSQWFRRGWTLQELLAPRELVFLDRNWTDIGTRSSHKAHIANCTGIADHHIGDSNRLLGKKISVAEILSWAQGRLTSRREDRAYCLLGFFSINIPLLYGEGDGAFDRLQGEIIRSSNDESIFLWETRDETKALGRVLAESPEDFAIGRRCLRGTRGTSLGLSRNPFAITNQGLEFKVPKELIQASQFLLPLNCPYHEMGELKGACAILLKWNDSESVWERNFDRWAIYSNRPAWESTVTRLEEAPSIYVVPVDWVWSRESLARKESEVIFLKVSR